MSQRNRPTDKEQFNKKKRIFLLKTNLLLRSGGESDLASPVTLHVVVSAGSLVRVIAVGVAVRVDGLYGYGGDPRPRGDAV